MADAAEAAQESDVIYGVEDRPESLLEAVGLGTQHVLTAFGATVAVPLLLGPAMGMEQGQIALLVSSVMLAAGLATLVQIYYGTRLPLIQGVSFAFVGPFFAIIGSEGGAALSMQYIAGAILFGAVIEMVIGYTGLMGVLRKYISPVVIGPTIALIGLALWNTGAPQAGLNWWLGGLTVVLAIYFSLVLSKSSRFFQLFPILLAVLAAYGLAILLSETGTFTPENAGFVDFTVVGEASWFRSPLGLGDGSLIFPWGMPKFSLAYALATLAGYLASMIESFGDYYSISYMAGEGDPTERQVNHGIAAEGIGCFITGLVGGFASTSYTENIGLVGLTKVASRFVVAIGAVVLIILGLVSKFGAVIATIPTPIVGGLYLALFGMITAVGLSTLMKCDMDSQRNQMIVGFITFMGLSLPGYFNGVPSLGYEAHTVDIAGVPWLGDIITTIGTTGMAVTAILGLFLDNVIEGTPEERGLDPALVSDGQQTEEPGMPGD